MKRSTLSLLMLLMVAGCGRQSHQTPDATTASSEPSADGGKHLLAAEPPNAANVIAARKEAQDEEDVVVVGRIGGSENPWIEGRAAFSIVDTSLKACSDIPGDNCPYPWDYCCETDKLPEATALVKIVDPDGGLVKADARKLLGVKELQTVVVHGKARRDESGNLTILADGVFVRK